MPPALAVVADSGYVGGWKSRRRLGWRRTVGASCPSPNPRNEVHHDGALGVRLS